MGCTRSLSLLCHWNGDNDIAESWLRYYTKLGVSHFEIILHGSEADSRSMIGLMSSYPIIIHQHYTGPFNEREKVRRLNDLLPEFMGQWVLLVDSDEIVELPYSSVWETIAELERAGCTNLRAPLLQRMRIDGSLVSASVVADLHGEFPLCAENLYEEIGAALGVGWLNKYPLFFVGADTVVSGGNHMPPNGLGRSEPAILGVTHHFKWRRGVVKRLEKVIQDGQEYAPYESRPYIDYLRKHDLMLPTDFAFKYSRQELFERGLLSRRDSSNKSRSRAILDSKEFRCGGAVPVKVKWRRTYDCTDLPSSVECRDRATGRHSGREPGHLVYGPYAPIQSGRRYVVRVTYRADSERCDVVGNFDVVVSTENHSGDIGNFCTLGATPLYGTQQVVAEVILPFHTNELEGNLLVETRLYVHGNVTVSAIAIDLVNID